MISWLRTSGRPCVSATTTRRSAPSGRNSSALRAWVSFGLRLARSRTHSLCVRLDARASKGFYTRARTASMKKKPTGWQVVLPLIFVVGTIAAPPRALAQTDHATKEATESQLKEGLQDPSMLFNLAKAEELTGHLAEALQHYKLFVADRTVAGGDRETALE